MIGRHITYWLLCRPDLRRIVVLARPSRTASAEARVERIVTAIGELPPGWQGRLRIIEGDVRKEICGLAEADRDLLREDNRGLSVFHAAANTRFSHEERDEIFETNLRGTENLLELLRKVGAREFHYFSTAYIFGDWKGVAYEPDSSDSWYGQKFRNPYEESKFLAERLVRREAERLGLAATIYRPSIVVGDSRTGKTSHFTGYYNLARGFYLVREEISRRLGRQPESFQAPGIYLNGRSLQLPITILGDPEATINIVCIDYVMELISRLAFTESSIGKTFHLVNPNPPKYGGLLASSLRALGISGFRVGNGQGSAAPEICQDIPPSNSALAKIERLVNQSVLHYLDYLSGEPSFDMSNVIEVLGGLPKHPVVDDSLVDRLIGYAVGVRFGKSRPENSS